MAKKINFSAYIPSLGRREDYLHMVARPGPKFSVRYIGSLVLSNGLKSIPLGVHIPGSHDLNLVIWNFGEVENEIDAATAVYKLLVRHIGIYDFAPECRSKTDEDCDDLGRMRSSAAIELIKLRLQIVYPGFTGH